MITSSTTAWTQVSHMKIHTTQAYPVLIMPYQDHEPNLYCRSISGSPSLSPNPVSPTTTNLGKQNHGAQLDLQSISFIIWLVELTLCKVYYYVYHGLFQQTGICISHYYVTHFALAFVCLSPYLVSNRFEFRFAQLSLVMHE